MLAAVLENGAGRQPDLHLVVSFRSRYAPVCPTESALTLSLLQSDDDFLYEQDIQRNPGSTKPWLVYIDFKLKHGSVHEQAFVMERACLQLPRSYKLWKRVSRLASSFCRAPRADTIAVSPV